jgi:hypothetical protein
MINECLESNLKFQVADFLHKIVNTVTSEKENVSVKTMQQNGREILIKQACTPSS